MTRRDTRTWSYQQRTRDLYVLFFDGVELAHVLWGKGTLHPHHTMIRIVRGLNERRPQRSRTWSVRHEPVVRIGEAAATLTHNGDDMASITWVRSVRQPDRWPVLMVDGLNMPGTAADPVPEPAPPTRLRRVV